MALESPQISLFNYVSAYACVCVWVGAGGGQKKVSDPPELELKAVMSDLLWVLNTQEPVPFC